MAAVYSTQLTNAPSVTGGPLTTYVVPAGYRAVIKTMSIAWGDVAVSGLDAWFQVISGVKLCRRTITFPGPDPMYIGGSAVFYVTWPIDFGDSLAVQTASGTADFFAGGYLLALP